LEIIMKISKKDALVLAKILHQHLGPYGLASSDADKSEFQDTLEDLSARVDEFLVYGEVADDERKHDCCVDKDEEEKYDDDETEDDGDEEEEDSGEEDEEDNEGEGEDEESSEEDDDDDSEEEELNVDSYVAAGKLHDLKAVKTEAGTVEFEALEDRDDDGVCDLLVDGYTEHSVTHVRRQGKELHVRDAYGEWHVYYVSKYPKGWTDVFPLGELVEIEA
jgi:hypothetical protein